MKPRLLGRPWLIENWKILFLKSELNKYDDHGHETPNYIRGQTGSLRLHCTHIICEVAPNS